MKLIIILKQFKIKKKQNNNNKQLKLRFQKIYNNNKFKCRMNMKTAKNNKINKHLIKKKIRKFKIKLKKI